MGKRKIYCYMVSVSETWFKGRFSVDYKFNAGILGSPWVGLKYFEALFNSCEAKKLIRNTLIII
ncbi:hypothetical protein M3223_16110 [Paenibacillus pasadenensis]|nr:hypothetical protein [Paenibacillus pasadenensis]